MDPAVAFNQYKEAIKPYWCSDAYFAIGEMSEAGKVAEMMARVREYRGVIATWDDKLGRIAVPPAAQPIVGKIRDLNATEMADLDALAGVDPKDEKQITRLTTLFYFDDASVGAEVDRLSAALGHPVTQGRTASNELEVAYQTFYKDIASVYDMFEAAMSRNDLNGAKAANTIEEDAAQHYIDQLSAIKWPAGFDGQVKALQDDLRGIIAFDRHQVDVPTTAQVVRAPDEGLPVVQAAEDAKTSLQDGLLKLPDSDPQVMCSQAS